MPSTFLITISNTEDLALLGAIEVSDTDNFTEEFRHGFRALFNDPKFQAIAVDFAEQTQSLAGEIQFELVSDEELIELSDAQQA